MSYCVKASEAIANRLARQPYANIYKGVAKWISHADTMQDTLDIEPASVLVLADQGRVGGSEPRRRSPGAGTSLSGSGQWRGGRR